MLPVLHGAKKISKLFNCKILSHEGYCKCEIDELITVFRVVFNTQHP